MDRKRTLEKLTETRYDIIVIGGGIYGACITWEATLRGLKVALIEKGDFGQATSANSLKTIHGGLRYLQNADFQRMRESIRELSTLMQIAPHLVHPLPCLMPTYGHTSKGREVMAVALAVNDLIGFDRNKKTKLGKQLPNGKIISRDECLSLISGVVKDGLSGGAIWYDGQVYNSERLTLAFVVSASNRGAAVVNYLKVTDFLRDGEQIAGVLAHDKMSGSSLSVQATAVINAGGPWADRILEKISDRKLSLGIRLAKAINIATRPIFKHYAIGLGNYQFTKNEANSKKVHRRHYFISPWRGQSLIGTTYAAYEGNPENLQVDWNEVQELLDEINQIYPPANLTQHDVNFVYKGLVPVSGVNEKTGTIVRAKHYQIRDHRLDGVPGLISVLGVKYTTARDVAEKVIDAVFESWGQKPPRSTSSQIPLHGGEIDDTDSLLNDVRINLPMELGSEVIKSLVYNYGTNCFELLPYFIDFNSARRPLPIEQTLTKAQIHYSIDHEMAMKLSDIMFRRTDLSRQGFPEPDGLAFCARIMGDKLNWSNERVQTEMHEVEGLFAPIVSPQSQGI